MPAGLPKGPVADKTDVKPPSKPSIEEPAKDVVQEPKGKEAAPKEPEVDLDEGDLKELKESQKVPYSRFKEVNDEKKTLEQQMTRFKEDHDLKLDRGIRDAELRIKAELQSAQEDEEYSVSAEPWEKDSKQLGRELAELKAEISTLQKSTSRTNLESQMTKLEAKYPKADTLAVHGWKMSRPEASLDELMALSHNRNLESAESALQEILTKKKDKAKAQSQIPSVTPQFRLSEGEKPKNLKDANDAAKKFLAERASN